MHLAVDHAIVAVRNLPAATADAERLGLHARAGGHHVGLGTENAIIGFPADYLELITIRDEAEARDAGPFGRGLLDALADSDVALVGFALASDDLDALAETFRVRGLDAIGPSPIRRHRPDGVMLSGRLLVPHGVPWCRPWPFFSQRANVVPGAQSGSHPWKEADSHASGATGIAGIRLSVRDLDATRALYAGVFGLPVRDLDTDRIEARVGDTPIEIVARPDLREGPLSIRLRTGGAGTLELRVENGVLVLAPSDTA